MKDDVLEMIAAEIRRVSDVTPKELRELAALLDPTLKKMKLKDFTAEYVDPARDQAPTRRRRKSRSKPQTRRKSSAGGTSRRGRKAASEGDAEKAAAKRRDAVRAVLLAFAKDLSGAVASPEDLVAVMADIDRYVNRVLMAADKE